MLTVPASLSQSFESQLSLRNIPDQQRRDCHKWLRFCLNFCAKYVSDPKLTASFAGFDEKLKIKGQSDAQRTEARRAIVIYYRMTGTLQSQTAPSGNSIAKSAKNPRPSTPPGTSNPDSSRQVGLPATKQEVPLKLAGANWEAVYERLQAAI
jgi:hypothetical protein